MLTASTPGAPLFARTFSHASRDASESQTTSTSSASVHLSAPPPRGCSKRRTARPLRSDPTGPSPLLRAGPPLCPASVLSHSQCLLLVVLPLAASNAGRLYRGDRFSCSMPAPATSSRHLYTGHRRGHIQAAPRLRAHRRRAFVPGPPTDPSFDAIVVSFRCVSSGSHMFVFSSHTRPANSETSTAALTTPALDRRSLRWFGSPPARRPRRTYLHHWHSTDRADDLLHRHHFPSGHTWVPETVSLVVRRHFGTR